MIEFFVEMFLLLRFIVRLLFAPLIVVLTVFLFWVLRLAYWLCTYNRIGLIYLSVPWYRYKRWCEVWSALQKSDSSRIPAAAILDDILRMDATAWMAALRKNGYAPPEGREPIVPESQNHNFLFHSLLRRGTRYMIFEREILTVGECVPLRITSREDWGDRGIVSIGEVFGFRCELRESPLATSRYLPTVSVGDRVLVKIIKSRGRSSIAELVDASQQQVTIGERGKMNRETYLVIASPWIYLELALSKLKGEPCCIIQEVFAPSCQDIPSQIQKTHRLVVRNGRHLSPKNLLLLGSTEFLMARCKLNDPKYPRQKELVFPSQFTVLAALYALLNTILNFFKNRHENHRIWKEIFTNDCSTGPSTLFRRAILFDDASLDVTPFWARSVGGALLHFVAKEPLNTAVDLKVKATDNVNTKGELYNWLEIFKNSEPRKILNCTRRWWVSKGGRYD